MVPSVAIGLPSTPPKHNQTRWPKKTSKTSTRKTPQNQPKTHPPNPPPKHNQIRCPKETSKTTTPQTRKTPQNQPKTHPPNPNPTLIETQAPTINKSIKIKIKSSTKTTTLINPKSPHLKNTKTKPNRNKSHPPIHQPFPKPQPTTNARNNLNPTNDNHQSKHNFFTLSLPYVRK